jgi:hypothetical protein
MRWQGHRQGAFFFKYWAFNGIYSVPDWIVIGGDFSVTPETTFYVK